MDYEKKYNEALERDKTLYENANGMILRKWVEQVFPELKESEDERIRQRIIHALHGDVLSTEEINQAIAWLEKKGEQKSKMKPKWLYRLEYKDNSCGLWYNGDGKWCFESGIGSLDDSCKTKSLPMDYDERYKQDGRDWFSSCTNKEDLLHWYSKEDAKILMSKGFAFTRYLATEYHEYEQQTVFIKETSLYREEIDFFSLFENQKSWSEEDEEIRNNCIYWLEKARKYFEKDEDLIYDKKWIVKCTDFIKSLKDRYAWKPSDEQIMALRWVLNHIPYDSHKEEISGLLEQLKKLREG